MGGLTAGILILSSLALLRRKEAAFPTISYKLPLWGPVLLSVGMFFLFLDLEYKAHFWRFYTAFRITSVMSWGAWILLLVYPVNGLLILITLEKGYPRFAKKLMEWIGEQNWQSWQQWAQKHSGRIAGVGILVGILLGMYTGILLSAFGARPFWNSALLGPIFLVSGVSTALALAALLSSQNEERKAYEWSDFWLISLELALLGLFLITLFSSSALYQQSVNSIMGGKWTLDFWLLVVFFGLFFPWLLEMLGRMGKNIPPAIAPILVLLGGLYFRYVILEVGQISTWIPY
ncbi:MAG: polysulfide reductase [Planctomycetota bacterium]|nr:MAG: polysulfide reductase [Planctomycetota bacterium]